MQKAMETLPKQTSLFGETELMFFQEVSPANRTHTLAKDLEKKMTATSGLKCLEQYEKFNQATSWGKTLLGLLIGMEDWYSTKCKLTWKMKGTKYNRLYFQLVVSTPRIEESEFGLWPTPVTSDATTGAIIGKNDIFKATSGLPRKINQNGTDGSVGLARLVQLIPTPRANKVHVLRENVANMNKGNLEEWVSKQMFLPTPNASDNRNRGNPNDPCIQKRIENGKQVGLTMMVDGQLNPQFVEEMMGFPIGWTDLKHLETQ